MKRRMLPNEHVNETSYAPKRACKWNVACFQTSMKMKRRLLPNEHENEMSYASKRAWKWNVDVDVERTTTFIRWNIVGMTALNASVHLPGLHAHSSPTDQLVMYVYASCNCTDWRNVLSLATNIRMLPAFLPYVRVLRSQSTPSQMCYYCTWNNVHKSLFLTLSNVFC